MSKIANERSDRVLFLRKKNKSNPFVVYATDLHYDRI